MVDSTLAVHNGKLYAGGAYIIHRTNSGLGSFTQAWTSLDGGRQSINHGEFEPKCPTLLSTPGGLLVGGHFDLAGSSNPLSNLGSITYLERC